MCLPISLTEERIDRSLQLAAAGFALDDSPATRANLLRALLRSPAILDVVGVEGLGLVRAPISPDGRTLALGAVDGSVTFLDARSGDRIGTWEGPGELGTIDWAPDGDAVAVAGIGPSANPGEPGFVHIVDPETQRLERSISVEPVADVPGMFVLPVAVFAPDGRSVIVGYHPDEGIGRSAPSALRRYDAATGEEIGRPVPAPAFGAWSDLLPTPEGNLIYAGERAAYAVDGETLRVARRYPGAGANVAALSPDGDTLALGGENGRVRLLDLDGGGIRPLPGGHREPVISAAFGPDGKTLVTGATGGSVLVWDLRLGRSSEALEGHSGDVLDLRVSADGRTLYSASADGTAIVWDLGGKQRFGARFETGFVQPALERLPPPVAVSPEDGTLAVGRANGRVELIDAETLRRRTGFEAFERSAAKGLEFSPDGRRLAVAGDRGLIGEFEAGSGKRIGDLVHEPRGRCADPRTNGTVPRCYKAGSQAIAFDPEGRTLAVGEASGRVRIWDLEGGEGARTLAQLPLFLPALALSPDGSQLAATFGLGNPKRHGTAILDTETGERIATLEGEADAPRTLDFSPDGRLLASGHVGGTALVWSTDDWRAVGPPLIHGGNLTSIRFSPDGLLLATSSSEGTTALWDVASGERIGPPLPRMADRRNLPVAGADRWATSRFSPDGRHLFVVLDTGHAVRWDLDPATWRDHACRVAGGGITPDEWERLVPEQDFRESCPS